MQLSQYPDNSTPIVGPSAAMHGIRRLVEQVAGSDATVLILGESGTGKEVVARGIHSASPRAQGPFVPVNCGAIPAELLESELFGHERGAFTGADRQRIGRFEYAQGGVLFLDEIGTMPLPLQFKVLPALQEREIIRIGSNEARPVDIRLISATSKNLLEECSAGTFREDLYYRINVVELRVPPLRERGEDILLLFNYFVGQAAVAYNRPEVSLQDADIGLMMNHDWPGNVRELKNIAERYVLSSVPIGQRLTSVLRSPTQGAANAGNSSLQELMRYHERLLLEQALIRHCGDVQAVMIDLDLPRRTLNEKMARHHLDRKNYL